MEKIFIVIMLIFNAVALIGLIGKDFYGLLAICELMLGLIFGKVIFTK